MDKKFAGRATLIAVVVVLFLIGIFPPGKLFNFELPWSKKHDLKPGLDIRGGTSLLYEIQPPAGNTDPNLSQNVADALKRRVDPNGVRGLIWRPQPPNRLEIQMPLGDDAEKNRQIREDFGKAEEVMESLNIKPVQVYSAFDTGNKSRLEDLAMGSTTRQAVIAQLTQAWTKLKQTQAAEKKAAEGVVAAQKAHDEARIAAAKAIGDLQQAQAQKKPPTELLPLQTEVDAKNRELTAKKDQYQAAIDARQPLFEARRAAEKNLKELEERLLATNLGAERVRAILSEVQGGIERAEQNASAEARQRDTAAARKQRDEQVAELKGQFADFPRRLAAIDKLVAQFDAYQRIRDSVDDAEGLKRLLRGSGVLEFRIGVTYDVAGPDRAAVAEMQDSLQKEGPQKAGSTMRWYAVDRPDEIGGLVSGRRGGQTYVLLYTTPDKSMVHSNANPWGLKAAYPTSDQRSGKSAVGFEFDARGSALFGELSGGNIGRMLAIVLDDKVISAPRLQSRIEGNGIITGSFSASDIDYMVRTLNAGSLPARLNDNPISERTVSPQLGFDNLRRGFIASLVGLVVVAVFLIGYYYFAGGVAMIAVMMNMVIILGAMAMFNATFTLPGIAALVLTVGMAVDANVLIFERLREEQHRGLSLRLAIRNAYDRAFSAILDSNVTTGITSVVLYWFGSEEVKGFGLTLLLGILSSMFSALFVTRTIFDFGLERWGWKKLGSLPLTFPKWDDALKPNIDWMGKAWIFYVASTLFIVFGLLGFVLKGREMFDVEFVKGTAVQVTLEKPMEIEDMRKLLAPYDKPGEIPSPQPVSIGTSDMEYEIVTPNDNASEVKVAVLKALEGKLTVQTPSRFEHSSTRLMDQGVAAATTLREAEVLVPVQAGANVSLSQAPFVRPEEVRDNGVAIILKNLNPPLTPREIGKRLERARLRDNLPYRQVDVIGDHGNDKPTTIAAILIADANIPYSIDNPAVADKWMKELAIPMWNLAVEAISQPPALERVTNFNPQVASATRLDAIFALALSTVLIVIYIWVRFGNLKYGTATVVALMHDTLITLGAIGISHYVADTWFGKALLIDPFRMNLTLVAAVLTVMGYSMNDTVVVFDRIRENRGKFGFISRQIINDSINQTLSRTLLTGGTTMITVFVMYVWGGPGIHGFTFALLIGILVGTYSSIAIAAPILLIGGKDMREATGKPAPVGQLQQA